MRFPEHISGDMWSHVRRKAYNFAFGAPNENVSKLPALNIEMEKHGHDLEYDTCDGSVMLACVLSLKKGECERHRAIARRVPVSRRTPDHIADLRSLSQQLVDFRESHSDFISAITAPGAKYVNYVAFAFSFVKGQFGTLLKFISADACFGKLHLDSFQVFSICGLTSNGNVVPLGYVPICGNEGRRHEHKRGNSFEANSPASILA